MPQRVSKTGSELFIVDNSDEDWKVVRYLHDWCQLSKSIDVATGFFEIGSLLSLKDEWQKVDKIRLLMGDEVSLRTKELFKAGLQKLTGRLDQSLEAEKQKNDFLHGVPAIVEAIRSGKIECRVYRQDKFHAKAYITHARLEVVGSSALVGSSNFTYPGITENIELNVQITGRPVNVLQEWFEEHWAKAEDVTPEILRTLQRQVHEYSPFEVYAKSLQELFRGQEISVEAWEEHDSVIYPLLDKYQQDGYKQLMKIAGRWNGALLCDGVGLGKTYIGLMLIERLIMKDRQRVALFVPKAARRPVWEYALRRHLPHLEGPYSNLEIFSHTDLLREKCQKDLDKITRMADVILIDEAHHFRNPGIKGEGEKQPSRYWRLFDIVEGKKLFLLTATPVNNSILDLQHMIELFTHRQAEYFKDIGIHSLPGRFRVMEKEIEKIIFGTGDRDGVVINQAEAQEVLIGADVFKTLVVQRSRAYVKESQEGSGNHPVLFPQREPPTVVDYSIKKTYGRLLDMMEKAFSKEKPLFILSIYYPLAYYKGKEDIDPFQEGRQKQVVALIRTLFLKRFESSAYAFRSSCETLLLKLLAWVEKHSQTPSEKRLLTMWKDQNESLLNWIQQNQAEMHDEELGEECEEDIITEEMLETIEELNRDEYDVGEIINDCFFDLGEIAKFLEELKKFQPQHDDKLKALIKLLKNDPQLKKHKVLIFSEFMSTARYLKRELKNAGIEGVDEVDSADKRDRGDILRQFAPYYNGSSSQELKKQEIRVLLSTDVLSEGLNLQDATFIINYDLHWNPVRLMQRIGRVDRRMDPEIEKAMLKDHPELKPLRGTVKLWNFLPPEELDQLLRLYSRVSHKTLRISKTFGIEGKKLLKPEDDYDALKNFNEKYEGTKTPVESMRLEFDNLLKINPGLKEKLEALPGRVFSGKEHPQPGTTAVFFCYALPAPERKEQGEELKEPIQWTEQAGQTNWYLFDLESEKIEDRSAAIVDIIRSEPDTPRRRAIQDPTLSEIRAKIEKHIKNTYLKQVQAPIGVKPALKAWMELS